MTSAHRLRLALAGMLIATIVVALAPTAVAGTLTGFLQSETGPQNAVVWSIGVTNIDVTAANNAQIDSATLQQVAGTACTPILVTPFPDLLGTIAPLTTEFANLTIDFTGCSPFDTGIAPDNDPALRFDLSAVFSADGFTGSLVLSDLTTKGDGTVFPTTAVPEPSALALFAFAVVALGLLSVLPRRRPA